MEFLIYILKSAGILNLFYLIYLFVLRKDTFFTANRTYLLTGIIASILFPFITFTTVTFVDAPTPSNTADAITEFTSAPTTDIVATATTVPMWQILLWVYLAGVALMFIHFLIQLTSLLRLLLKNPSYKINRFRFVEIQDTLAPFSFFSYIVFNPTTHDAQELEMILKHEKVHASQWHSIDLLLANLVRAFQWANPISWFYKTSLEANLEFLADNETARYVPSKTAYQLALLKASSALPVPALTNNFYHSSTRLNVFGRPISLGFQNGQVKKRIIMLNKRSSNKYNQFKLMLVLPALALFLWSFNTVEVVKYKEVNTNASEAVNPTISPNKMTLQFSAETTDFQLDAIENYFGTHHPESLVKIDNRKRNAEGLLTNFSFTTKFKGNDHFYTRFDRGAKVPIQTIYQLAVSDKGELLVTETGKETVQIKITKDNLVIANNKVLAPTSDLRQGKMSSGDTSKKIQLGKNPLYIINGKKYLKNELPIDKTIQLDGTIEMFNPEDGAKKYGKQGEDGVLVFNGVSTFVKVPTPTTNVTTPLQTPKSKINQASIDSEKISEVKRLQTDAVKEVRIKITKNTTKEKLDAIKEELKRDHNIIFNYKNVNFNAKNEITSISVSYKGNGMSGSYSVNDDDGDAIDDFYFYMDTEEGTSGFGSEKIKERMKVREKMLSKREKMRETSIDKKRETMSRRRSEMAEIREEIREEQKDVREEVAKLRENSRKLMNEERKIARGYAQIARNKSAGRGARATIYKNTTDAELATIKKEMEAKGVTFNYSRVKRNANGEITRIKIQSDNGMGSKQTISTSTDDDEPIEMIVIEQ